MKIIISDKQIERLKKLIDKLGINNLGIEPYKLIEMGLVKSLSDDLDLRNTPIKSLGNLEYVGGSLYLENSSIEDLGNLKHVGGNLELQNTPIKSLGNLEYIGEYLNIFNTPISDETLNKIIEKFPSIGIKSPKGKIKISDKMFEILKGLKK